MTWRNWPVVSVQAWISCCGPWTHQDVPNVTGDSLEAAEADGDADQAVAPPQGAGRDDGLPQGQGSAAVELQGDGPTHVLLQHVLQGVVVLVLAGEKLQGDHGGRITARRCGRGRPTSLVSPMEMMKSKKGSSPAWWPGEFSWTFRGWRTKCFISSEDSEK